MGRRKGTVRIPCNHTGCQEVAFYEYDGLEERNRVERQHRTTHKCIRHMNADEVLSLENLRREMILTVGTLPNTGDHLFWVEKRNGFIHGPGFKGFAEDFPVGTRVRVLCEVLPQ